MRKTITVVLLTFVFLLVSSCKAPSGKTTEGSFAGDVPSASKIYEQPQVLFVKYVDNTKIAASLEKGQKVYEYCFIDKDGNVYEYHTSAMYWALMLEDISDGKVPQNATLIKKIEDKEGLQKNINKFQIILNIKGFRLKDPELGLDWSQTDISWYGLYLDDEKKLQAKQFSYITNLEEHHRPSDPIADEITSWLESQIKTN